ncbi:MAG: hypothetical protein WAQ27_01295 [Candidatus Microsaccharimonas sp.]
MNKNELWERGRSIVLEAPQLYVDVDVEADGIAGYGSMLSVGAQSPTGESFYSEIRPYSRLFLPGHREFCEEHGLERERLFAEAPDVEVAMNGLAQFIAGLEAKYAKKPVLTAFNAAFDFAHVDLAFKEAHVEDNPFGFAPFDLKSLAIPLTGDWNFSLTKKSALPPEIVPDGDFTHHALEDAQYQQKLHFGMAALLSARR